jgi:hypothetical protein
VCRKLVRHDEETTRGATTPPRNRPRTRAGPTALTAGSLTRWIADSIVWEGSTYKHAAGTHATWQLVKPSLTASTLVEALAQQEAFSSHLKGSGKMSILVEKWLLMLSSAHHGALSSVQGNERCLKKKLGRLRRDLLVVLSECYGKIAYNAIPALTCKEPCLKCKRLC